jgi:hypothetical protein
VGDFEGYLHWFDIVTGDLQARVHAGSEPISTQPLVVDDILYAFSENGTIYAYRVKEPKKR